MGDVPQADRADSTAVQPHPELTRPRTVRQESGVTYHNPFIVNGKIRFPENTDLVRHVEKWAKVRGDRLAYRFLDFSTERDGIARDISRIAIRSPGWVTCCSRAPTARLRAQKLDYL